MKKIPTGRELEQLAESLGVDTQGPPRTRSSSGRAPKADDYELQRRVIEASRAIRESRYWIVALVSAIASVVSAIGALVAVFFK